MKKIFVISLQGVLLLSLFACSKRETIGTLMNGAKVYLQKNEMGKWNIAMASEYFNSVSASPPCGIELYSTDGSIEEILGGYDSIEKSGDGFMGYASIEKQRSATFHFEDRWQVLENTLSLNRMVKVGGDADGGFLSSVVLNTGQEFKRDEVNLFAPGMIYGGVEHISDSAIGGRDLYNKGEGILWIREDRLPAPVLGMILKDLSSVAVLNPLPDGRTDTLDSHDRAYSTLIDSAVRLGALGLINKDGYFATGYHYPCSEGEYSYRAETYHEGRKHRWTRRYHPVKDGFEQQYSVTFRFSNEKTFADFYTDTWRWAWQTLKPQIVKQDIELAKQSLLDMLAGLIQVTPERAGIISFRSAVGDEFIENLCVMGFVGRALEVSNYLLYASLDTTNTNAGKYRELAYKMMDSFLEMPLDPPAGEGYHIETGEFCTALELWFESDGVMPVYLRSFCDGLKTLLKAALREGPESYHYQEYIAWARSFTDWLLSQKTANGGFPRKWEKGTGEILDSSGLSSYNAVPMLVLMSRATGESKYLEAAVEAAEFSWNHGQAQGIFVGGTLDNPNVIDKEAGTLSLEAYLALYEQTEDEKWLERAVKAANFAETWIYAWDVPMPADESDELLHWKKGNSTVGLQLITTGHSLTDLYMSFDADEYARLAKYSNDPHYMDVAGILLHNTKQMLAIPGRLYDLNGPGWQQEHWSIAPLRGFGSHRDWLPWVSTSHLNGIYGLEEFDKDLYEQLKK
jgi:hypothetical protein